MNRRNFLACSSSLALSSDMLFAEELSFNGRIKKAVKFGKKPDEILMNKIVDLGFDGIEGSAPGLQVHEMKKVCQEMHLAMHGVVYNKHWKVRLSDPDPQVRRESRLGLAQAMKESKGVGGTSVLLVPGRVKGDQETHQDLWDRSIRQIRKLIPLAEELRVHILIETVWNGFCYQPEQFRDYIDEIESPWVQAYFDIGNMQKFAPSYEWIRILGKRTLKLDVKDWGSKNGFCPLGQGDVDWKKVRQELEKTEFAGWATREGNDGGLENTVKLMDQFLGL